MVLSSFSGCKHYFCLLSEHLQSLVLTSHSPLFLPSSLALHYTATSQSGLTPAWFLKRPWHMLVLHRGSQSAQELMHMAVWGWRIRNPLLTSTQVLVITTSISEAPGIEFKCLSRMPTLLTAWSVSFSIWPQNVHATTSYKMGLFSWSLWIRGCLHRARTPLGMAKALPRLFRSCCVDLSLVSRNDTVMGTFCFMSAGSMQRDNLENICNITKPSWAHLIIHYFILVFWQVFVIVVVNYVFSIMLWLVIAFLHCLKPHYSNTKTGQ